MTAGLIKSTGLLIGIKNHFQSMKLIYLFLISLTRLASFVAEQRTKEKRTKEIGARVGLLPSLLNR
jgi:hypothetical protein